jgi:hypothetical protein
MIAGLPNDDSARDVSTGILKGKWGLASVAVGPIVPFSADFQNPPQRHRYLVTGRVFDDDAVRRLGEDFVIDGLHIVDPAASELLKIDLADPNGTIVGAIAWSPGRLGNQAYSGVNPAVLTMLLIVGMTMAFLVVFAVCTPR